MKTILDDTMSGSDNTSLFGFKDTERYRKVSHDIYGTHVFHNSIMAVPLFMATGDGCSLLRQRHLSPFCIVDDFSLG